MRITEKLHGDSLIQMWREGREIAGKKEKLEPEPNRAWPEKGQWTHKIKFRRQWRKNVGNGEKLE